MSDISKESISKLKKLNHTNESIRDKNNNYRLRNKGVYQITQDLANVPESDIIEVLSQPKRKNKSDFWKRTHAQANRTGKAQGYYNGLYNPVKLNILDSTLQSLRSK